MECYSECILMMLMYCFMMFSEFVPELSMRRYIGYASMALVCFHLGLSLNIMMKDTIQLLMLRYKWYLERRKNFKIREEKIDAQIKETILTA